MVATVRAFARVNAEGGLAIPAHVRTLAGLKPGQLVEVKVMGAGKKSLLVTAREAAR